MEPKLSITRKPPLNPMNNEGLFSNKECELFENFQILCYYLSNVLYSMIPILQEAVKLRIAESGRLSHLEEPEVALRQDQLVRNMNMYTFTPIKMVAIKLLSQRFRTQSEDLFLQVMDESGIS